MGKARKKSDNNKDHSQLKNDQQLHRQLFFTHKTSFFGLAIVLLIAACLVSQLYYFNYSDTESNIETLASVNNVVADKVMTVDCPKDYELERKLYPDCAPRWCGRIVADTVVPQTDALRLLEIAKSGFIHGGSDGGASILDLHSGALSKGNRFINIYSMMSTLDTPIFDQSDFDLYSSIKNSIQAAIAKQFGIRTDRLYLTKPTFFSRMTTQPAKTLHDEYWHVHVDKETYGSFHYTSLLYLSDYATDFAGGRFVFVDDNRNVTVEPRVGRLSYFTSGTENRHFVEKLEKGTRYAITVSFTCDSSKSIDDPKLLT